jgi:hypothetical protein
MSHEARKCHKIIYFSFTLLKYCFYDINFRFYIGLTARVLDTYVALLYDIPNALHQLL